ncbi:hypothetical protein H6P81_007890 [Aristolochia fimbriata]|uniref:Uncharacterized protein n=1 Tax=Aristolochia fimbriata TaxID=158543 RepID=A0AAV7F2S4_ARIFI|nr:hypothetical protein H6P81_007890 [Aristolochia fimbriata]
MAWVGGSQALSLRVSPLSSPARTDFLNYSEKCWVVPESCFRRRVPSLGAFAFVGIKTFEGKSMNRWQGRCGLTVAADAAQRVTQRDDLLPF